MKYISALGKNIWFSVFVILPTVVAIFYYGLIASDQYVSESQFTVKNPSKQAASLTGIASLFQSSGMGAGQEQDNEVISYIESRGALAELQRKINVRALYANSQADSFSRYPAFWRSDRFENLFRYYRGMVDAHADTESGLVNLSTRAYTAEDAHRINALLLDLSEKLVNQLNEKAREKAISEAQSRVAIAEDRVRKARLVLADYRNQQGLLDPAKQGEGVLEVSDKLQMELSHLQSQLSDLRLHTPKSPLIPALQGRAISLGNQISLQNGRAAGTTNGIASKLGSYQKLLLEQEFSAQTLTVASASLEQARIEADRQQFYLERVVEPNVPDIPLLPHRALRVVSIAAIALCLYLVGWMLVVGILEHSPED